MATVSDRYVIATITSRSHRGSVEARATDSGIVSKRKDKLYSFRTADIWHAPSFKTVIWNELALMFWQSSFDAAALDTGIA